VPLTRTDNSCRARGGRLQLRLRCRSAPPRGRNPRCSFEILIEFPFCYRLRCPAPKGRDAARSYQGFRPCIRTDSPSSNRSSRGTLFYFSSQGFHLINRYYHQDLHRCPVPRSLTASASARGPRPLTHSGQPSLICRLWRWISGTLRLVPFSGLLHSASELLHTP